MMHVSKWLVIAMMGLSMSILTMDTSYENFKVLPKDITRSEFAMSLASDGKTDETIRFLQLNMKDCPKSSPVFFLLGDIRSRKIIKEEAIKALELGPKNNDAKQPLSEFR